MFRRIRQPSSSGHKIALEDRDDSSVLMVQVVNWFGTLAPFYQTTRSHIIEDTVWPAFQVALWPKRFLALHTCIFMGQHVPPKRNYPPARLHGVTAQKIAVWTVTAVKISDLPRVCPSALSTQVTPPRWAASPLNNPLLAQTLPRKRNLDPSKKHCLKYSASPLPNYPLWRRSYLS
jgi:hypothetical protein